MTNLNFWFGWFLKPYMEVSALDKTVGLIEITIVFTIFCLFVLACDYLKREKRK